VAEGGHELLDLLALALRAGHRLAPEDEGLKCIFAFFATEFENRHMNVTFLDLHLPMKIFSSVLLPWWEEEVEEGENPLPSTVC
jgi:hypothetical protein